MCQTVFDASNSSLMQLLSIEYRQPNPFNYNYEIFPAVSGLKPEDAAELQKFMYVDDAQFADAFEEAIDRDYYDLFRY
jgi:hypothetical protein